MKDSFSGTSPTRLLPEPKTLFPELLNLYRIVKKRKETDESKMHSPIPS